jgi:hypothetical protein
MAMLSYDGQSFSIDGRRIWLVSGAIHYARVPRGLWRDRIRAAKQAGLNCVETYVFWNIHEQTPGQFNWEGQNDLRAFVQLVGEAGMYCIVRPGPYVCAEWDGGGLPGWLHTIKGMVVREENGPFLEACSRYLTQVLAQVRDLQITTTTGKLPRDGQGPIAAPVIMMQAENEWICSNPLAAVGDEKKHGYLREIVRYLRENGCEVPINICNNLWQRVDGTIDTWNANQHLATDLRQLKVVQPNAPRFVTEFWPGWFDQWGGEHHTKHTPEWNSYRLAQILASGAMYNLFMFHGGTNFGFVGGRSVAGPDCFMTTSYDYDAPLREAGGRGEKYAAVKRISTFASQFGNVFAHLHTDAPHVAVTPDDGEHPLSVIHQPGAQGDVVFFLRSESDQTQRTSLLLANGLTLPVELGASRAAWLLLNARLSNGMELTYTNLRPWAMVEQRMLVLFGPAGSHGIVAIDGAQLDIGVPAGKSPSVHSYEGLQIVVLNEEQVDVSYILPDGLVVGAAGLDGGDKPIALEGWPSAMVVSMDGKVTRRSMNGDAKRPTAPKLGAWKQARQLSYLDGSNENYREIKGPASLEQAGCDLGYGWYRLTHKTAAKGKHVLPRGGDRLHVYNDGKLDTILGLGPSAEYDPTELKLGPKTVVLADNLGRYNFGWNVGNDPKGLADHLYATAPVKLGKPTISQDVGPNPFDVQQCVLYQRVGDRPRSTWYEWSLSLRGEKTLMLDIQRLAVGAVVYVNDVAVGLYHPLQTAGIARFRIGPGEPLKNGKNIIRLGLIAHDGEGIDVAKHVKLYELTKATTANAAWAFAPLAVPAEEEFGTVVKSAGMQPCFYRVTFKVSHTDQPLWLEPTGMSKGQMYLNGVNVGRYFVGTHTGKSVGPQERYYLPEPWLKTDGENELILFDEHGKSPAKCKLVYDRMGPYGQ